LRKGKREICYRVRECTEAGNGGFLDQFEAANNIISAAAFQKSKDDIRLKAQVWNIVLRSMGCRNSSLEGWFTPWRQRQPSSCPS
jgi:hypothetical protein